MNINCKTKRYEERYIYPIGYSIALYLMEQAPGRQNKNLEVTLVCELIPISTHINKNPISRKNNSSQLKYHEDQNRINRYLMKIPLFNRKKGKKF